MPTPHLASMTMSTTLRRADAWRARWRPILPVLAAELILWTGFAALLPVLPLYMVERGVDVATLGLVVAAWPAALFLSGPVFGLVADRTARLPLMVGGLLVTSVVAALPLIFTGAGAFIVLRAVAGMAAGAYDPAARGFLLESTPRERHGEVFGIYSSAQMGGTLIGPAIGGLGAALFGGYVFPFAFAAVASLLAAIVLATTTREPSRGDRRARQIDVPDALPDAGLSADVTFGRPSSMASLSSYRPSTLVNRTLAAAAIFDFASYFAQGVYEVVWSLFLAALGAGVGLIGLTFVAFGFPVLVFSPMVGRRVDRAGTVRFIVAGSLMAMIAGILYPLIPGPLWAIPIVIWEGAGFAMFGPALYTLASQGSPRGRESTGQGIVGSAGTLGFVVASIIAGRLYATDFRYPFWAFAIVSVTALVIGLIVGFAGRRQAPDRPGLPVSAG
jgi:DHA1 family multidrug resistance protein-like MFS transporter